jgi:hypothetical protein
VAGSRQFGLRHRGHAVPPETVGTYRAVVGRPLSSRPEMDPVLRGVETQHVRPLGA